MAALARFEQAKNASLTPEGGSTPTTPLADADDSETESESEIDDEGDPVANMKDAVDINGKKILDPKGRPVVRVCEDEDTCHDLDARNEFAELGQVNGLSPKKPPTIASKQQPAKPPQGGDSVSHIQDRVTALLKAGGTDGNVSASHIQERIAALLKSRTSQTPSLSPPLDEDDISTASEDEEAETSKTSSRTSLSLSQKSSSENKIPSTPKLSGPGSAHSKIPRPQKNDSTLPVADGQIETSTSSSTTCNKDETTSNLTKAPSPVPAPPEVIKSATALVCGVCSLENEVDALTCMVCSNVLDLERLPNYWYCKSTQCRGSVYVNHGDSGACGVCGTKKQAIRWDD